MKAIKEAIELLKFLKDRKNTRLTTMIKVQSCIAELEALQQRSCESCEHLLHKLEYQSPFCLGHNYRLTHENKKVLSCNRYEPKEQQ